ncbi:TATA box-binding protein-associated factor RNA polymerase I subunit C [Pseudorasbora parva]|uniref:TATA box-binding protein-associated factor RNA polymerase I subunit C n=1 Tax=Pseudorasbora parva TaxID=51549 RepID=UPI00351DB50C
MNSAFPNQLFPQLYLDGPPETETQHNYGGWGSYERLLAVSPGLCDGEQPSTLPRFEPQNTVSGEEWVPVKPAVTPLMPAFEDGKVSCVDLPDPMDFPEHMQYFYQHHYMDAFSTMGHLLRDDLTFSLKGPENALSMRWSKGFVEKLNYKRCESAHMSRKIRHLHHLLKDIVTDVPPSLLSSLLYEELTSQREQLQFSPDTTGGALGYVPLYEGRGGSEGCFIYPSGEGMDKLYFHRVVQQYNDDKPPSFVMEPKPIVFYLNGTIRQLSLDNMEDVGNVAVRSDYCCGVWLIGDKTKPRLLDVIQTKDRFSCVTVSPHLPNEVLVVNEQGAAYLWTVQKGLQKFRQESSNLYFNAKSPWRWCEFSCHPRVMVYADRTGVELTDMRSDDSHTLFRIGKTPACVSGERVILAKYLGKSHANHHLINTQFSSYIMDERVPSVPMLKWNHMMESPPIFACGLPAQTPSQTSKLLLGTQRSQEVMLLQYTGGKEHACQAQGPIQRLFSPKESLSHLDLQLPHKKHLAQERLNVPITGFSVVRNKDYVSVFQLSDAGDIFFQTIKLTAGQTTTNEDVPEQAVVGEHTVESAHLEVVNNVDDCLNASDTSISDISKDPLSCSIGNNTTCSTRPPNPTQDPDLQVAWNKWFKPIFKKASGKKRHSYFRRIRTNDLKGLKGKKKYKLVEDCMTRLRRDLQDVMRKKESLSHGVTYLPHLEVTPVPNPVDPDDWDDDVSQRLAASWEGNWKNWWEEKLGLNRAEKIAALRRKRQRAKQARARHRTSLAGSFTSSVSYQESVLCLPSVGSQVLDSNDETSEKSQATDVADWRSRSEMRKKSRIILRRFLNDQSTVEEPRSPERSPLQSPQRRRDLLTSPSKSQSSLQVEQPTSSTPNVAERMDSGPHQGSSTSTLMPTSQSKRRKEFYLDSVPTSQTCTQNSARDDGFSLSQIRLSSPTQSSKLSLSSQRVSQLRSSSQASQTKKKSRMGF